MANKNLHNKPFSEETLLKLDIFERYAQAWLPTFVMSTHHKDIYIFDFFAGRGYDLVGKKGSPIRILDKVNEQLTNIIEKKVHIHLYFNEYDKNKYNILVKECETYLANSTIRASGLITIRIENKDFKDAYPAEIENIKNKPSLVFIDQNGVKFLHEKYFIPLTATQKTDFLYFVSSSYIPRFEKTPEFEQLNLNSLKNIPSTHVHRFLVKELERKITNPNMKLYSFSIKKGSNIYGIVFGASHPRAVDKFLSLAWKMNSENGEANYDIDDDTKKSQLSFFEAKSLTKKEEFMQKLRKKILDKTLITNKSVLDFVYSEGHIPEHAKEVLKALKKEKLVFFDNQSPLITYESVYKNKNIIQYEVLKN